MTTRRGRPRWMMTFRFFMGDVFSPILGAAALTHMFFVNFEAFTATRATIASALVFGGPSLVRLLEATLGRMK